MENRLFKLNDIAKGDDSEAKKTVVYSSDSTTAAVWVVKPNQFIPTHKHTTSDDLWICIHNLVFPSMYHQRLLRLAKSRMIWPD